MKRSASKIAALVLLLLLSGCGGRGTEEPTSPEDAVNDGYVPSADGSASTDAFMPPKRAAFPELEETDWQAVSIDAGDFGVTEKPIGDPESYGGAASLPLDRLIAFSLSADGAAAEDLSDELRRRFLKAPNTVLTYLVLMGGQQDDYWNTSAAELVCGYIASADAAWYGDTEEFTQTIAACREASSSGRISELLDAMEREHAASLERNQ